ncbi:ParB N-terminal domain-containing protein [Aestuariivirga sp. YIM B02566]|uniref:ParB N-terminal domain-containing protein n=1 Tax=Taklimakanibacter albus TaxID=2800327 RepID=A0ACC5R6K1_9HYPH|nr:ParB/RepB/Spo0J family partition protein [Aestuariivirga sp. YIM B02566]MBK1868289.1 ParB N-terminal domain-containing protein [Aestuariivirga sp. YIM B02566]
MKLVEVRLFPIEDIEVGDRIREVNDAKAAVMAETIKKNGLLQPIEIVKRGNKHVLVFGAHRLAAHKLLGMEEISARVVECETDKPDLEIRLRECVENVGREELTALDRAGHLAELKRVYEELYPDSRRGVAGAKKKHDAATPIFGVADEIASKAGLSKQTFFAAVAVWNGLAPETRKAVTGTWLADNGAQLAQLAKVEQKKQGRVLSLVLPAKEGEKPKAASISDAVSIIDNKVDPKSADEAAFAALVKAWHKAPHKAQRQFVEYLRQHKALSLTPTKKPPAASKKKRASK